MDGFNNNRPSDSRYYGLLHSDVVSQYLTDCILDNDSGTLPTTLLDADHATPVRFRWTGSRCEEIIYNMELLG